MAHNPPQLPGTVPVASASVFCHYCFSYSQDFCSYHLLATATVIVGTAADWVVVTDNFAIVTSL